MGKKAGWLNAVKKAFSPSKDGDKEAQSTKDHQQKTISKEKKRWSFGKPLHHQGEALTVHPDLNAEVGTKSEKMASISEKSLSLVEEEQNSHALAVAAATAAAAEAAVAAAQAAAEVVRLTGGAAHPPPYYPICSREEQAAVEIQAAFRGYLARRAFRALQGLMRLQVLVRGHTVKRQATATLRCMQSLVKVQAEVRERRLQKSEEQKRLHAGLLWQAQHRDDAFKRSLSDASRQDGWDGSVHSADEAHSKYQFKQEATARREQALAYAYSHQIRCFFLVIKAVGIGTGTGWKNGWQKDHQMAMASASKLRMLLLFKVVKNRSLIAGTDLGAANHGSLLPQGSGVQPDPQRSQNCLLIHRPLQRISIQGQL